MTTTLHTDNQSAPYEGPLNRLAHRANPAVNAIQAQHRPNTPWDAQRTQGQMIQAMQPLGSNVSPAYLADQERRWREAWNYIRERDAARVRRFTGLKSPFVSKAA